MQAPSLLNQQSQPQVMPGLEVAKPPAAVQMPSLAMGVGSPLPLPDIPPLSTSSEEALRNILKPKFREVTLEQIRMSQANFAFARDWDKFHSPRNLLLALTGEVGELAEIFQWRGEVPRGLTNFSPAEKHHVGEELSDVLLYLVRLADVCNVDLAQAVMDKLLANETKYPVEACRGSAVKYTQLRRDKSPLSAPIPMLPQQSLDDAMKRKRFSDDQIGALTQMAEGYNWSLSAVPQDERDRVLAQYGISKERLQNFFNNRKPKDMKKARLAGSSIYKSGTSVSGHGSEDALDDVNAAEQLQSLHQPVYSTAVDYKHEESGMHHPQDSLPAMASTMMMHPVQLPVRNVMDHAQSQQHHQLSMGLTAMSPTHMHQQAQHQQAQHQHLEQHYQPHEHPQDPQQQFHEEGHMPAQHHQALMHQE